MLTDYTVEKIKGVINWDFSYGMDPVYLNPPTILNNAHAHLVMQEISAAKQVKE